MPANGQFDADVIIIGAGPVGKTLANLLGIYGLSVIILEKEKEIYPSPRAVGVDDESLRIWQSCGLENEILQYVIMGEYGDTVFTYRNCASDPIFTIKQKDSPYGYAKGAVLLQPAIEKILQKGLTRFKRIQLLLEHEAQSLAVEEHGAVVRGKNAIEDFELRAKYVVGCDGGGSLVRSELGISMKGFSYDLPWLIVDVLENRDHSDRLSEGVEVWCDSKRPTVTIPLPYKYRRWEFMLQKNESAEDFLNDNEIKNLIATRKANPIIEITRKMVRGFSAKIAANYRKGRFFLMGDAAHVTPPFAGQGLATGLRDAANLSWKLAGVVKETFPEELLDTYDQERRPHQKRMLALAVTMGRLMMPGNRAIAFSQNTLLTLISRLPILRNLLEIRGQRIQPIYHHGFIGSGKNAGQYIIQPVIKCNGKTYRLDYLLGDSFAIICFGAAAEEIFPPTQLQYWQKLNTKILRYGYDFTEEHHLLENYFNQNRIRAVVIRPDRFIFSTHF